MSAKTVAMRDPLFPNSVRIGGMTKGDLLQALHEHDVKLNEAAETLFQDSRFAPQSQVDVVEIEVVAVAELGFPTGALYGELTERALDLGLDQCPLELAPHLRLQFLNQAEGAAGFPATAHQAPPGSLTIASPPLDDRDQTPKGFYLRRINGVLWLRGYWAPLDNRWQPQDVLVFARDGTRHRARLCSNR